MAYRLVFIAGYLDRNYGHFNIQKLQSSSFSIASFHSINQTYFTLPQSTEMPR